MTSISRSVFLAAALATTPLVAALAQNNPTGNYGSNRSTTAAPVTGDSTGSPGMNTGDVNGKSTMTNSYGTSATKPGSTGRTVVPGNNSSVASDTGGTAKTQSGGTGGGGK